MAGIRNKLLALLALIFTWLFWSSSQTPKTDTLTTIAKKLPDNGIFSTIEKNAYKKITLTHPEVRETAARKVSGLVGDVLVTDTKKAPQHGESSAVRVTPKVSNLVKDDLGMCNVVPRENSQHRDVDVDKGNTDVVCCVMVPTQTSAPFDIALHCNPSILGEAIFKTGIWETGITNRITSILLQLKTQGTHSDVFMDIGGNVGYFSLLAASLGYSVLTVEAMRYNTQLIKRSIASNPHFDERMTVLHRALVSPEMVAKGVASVCLDMPKGNADNGIVNTNSNIGNCGNPINTTTVDAAIVMTQTTKSPVAIKMDIEGFEGHALSGALQLLHASDSPCYIWFEYTKSAIIAAGSGQYMILETLANASYELKDIDPSSKTLFISPWRNVPSNFFGEARNRRSGCAL